MPMLYQMYMEYMQWCHSMMYRCQLGRVHIVIDPVLIDIDQQRMVSMMIVQAMWRRLPLNIASI
jgi:hypothetical protein